MTAITLILNDAEQQALHQLLDTALRQAGLNALDVVSHFVGRIAQAQGAAVQPQRAVNTGTAPAQPIQGTVQTSAPAYNCADSRSAAGTNPTGCSFCSSSARGPPRVSFRGSSASGPFRAASAAAAPAAHPGQLLQRQRPILRLPQAKTPLPPRPNIKVF